MSHYIIDKEPVLPPPYKRSPDSHTSSEIMEETSSLLRHEGKKYLRTIYDATTGSKVACISIDIYEVLVAFDVTCPARGHAIKKLLTAGQRGKGDTLADLKGALAALQRAIELQERQEALDNTTKNEKSEEPNG